MIIPALFGANASPMRLSFDSIWLQGLSVNKHYNGCPYPTVWIYRYPVVDNRLMYDSDASMGQDDRGDREHIPKTM